MQKFPIKSCQTVYSPPAEELRNITREVQYPLRATDNSIQTSQESQEFKLCKDNHTQSVFSLLEKDHTVEPKSKLVFFKNTKS